MNILKAIKKVVINLVILYFFITIPVFIISGFIYNECFKENIYYRNNQMINMALELQPLLKNKYSVIEINKGRGFLARFLFAQTKVDYNERNKLTEDLIDNGYILISNNNYETKFYKNNFIISIIYASYDNNIINLHIQYDDYITNNNI